MKRTMILGLSWLRNASRLHPPCEKIMSGGIVIECRPTNLLHPVFPLFPAVFAAFLSVGHVMSCQVAYCNAEQWMMASKAKLFKDT